MKPRSAPVAPALCMVCSRPVTLHFDIDNRKLDCSRVLAKDTALAHARRKAIALARYIARLESLA